jgi:signal transduction histidine kinase
MIQEFWHCLTSVGADGITDEREAKYIRFSNVVATLTALAVFSYIPFSLYMGHYTLAVLQFIDTLCVLCVLLFNYWGYNSLARHAYLITVNGFVLINSCMIGYQSKVHEFFYISYIVPFLLFSVKDYKNIVIGVVVAILFFNLYFILYPYFESYNLDLNSQQTIYRINLWMKFVLFGVAIYILSYYNHISERQLEEANAKLTSKASELKRSNEDLEQFASIISHDLKAPVSNISSFMQLLQRRYASTLDKDANEFINLSKKSADRMAKQIEDLLSYSKMGRNLPTATLVDLNEVIKTIKIELGGKVLEKNAKITQIASLPTITKVHTSMIHHIFQNLVANGIKFNTNVAPEVVIDYQIQGSNYVFEVRDNGIGIDAAYKDKLFQMFKRLHSNEEFEGTGIGLAVCKKIVDFYGGDIWFDSKPGMGTSFFFTLPRNQELTSQTYIAKVNQPAEAKSVSFA